MYVPCSHTFTDRLPWHHCRPQDVLTVPCSPAALSFVNIRSLCIWAADTADPSQPSSSVGSSSGQTDEAETSEEWAEVGRKNKASVTRQTAYRDSPVSDVFRGQLRSTVIFPQTPYRHLCTANATVAPAPHPDRRVLHHGLQVCKKGSKPSVTIEPFNCLPIDIKVCRRRCRRCPAPPLCRVISSDSDVVDISLQGSSGEIDSVAEAIKLFLKPETLEGFSGGGPPVRP